MKEARGNIFKMNCDAVCITTNGFVKSNGENVMGRGCAHQAKEMIPQLPRILGSQIVTNGNHVHKLWYQNETWLLSFPVKTDSMKLEFEHQRDDIVSHKRNHFNIGDTVPGWACVADERIITTSARELVALADMENWNTVILPRPGCGAGELSWKVVRSHLKDILDDRFTCVTF